MLDVVDAVIVIVKTPLAAFVIAVVKDATTVSEALDFRICDT
jgi:hypothetical protein